MKFRGKQIFYAWLRLSVHTYTTVNNSQTCDNFFRNHEPSRVAEMSLSYSQNMPIYYSSGKCELSICSFLEDCYNCFHARYFTPLEKIFGEWQTCTRKFFSPEFVGKPFTWQTFKYPFQMKSYFSIKHFF